MWWVTDDWSSGGKGLICMPPASWSTLCFYNSPNSYLPNFSRQLPIIPKMYATFQEHSYNTHKQSIDTKILLNFGASTPLALHSIWSLNSAINPSATKGVTPLLGTKFFLKKFPHNVRLRGGGGSLLIHTVIRYSSNSALQGSLILGISPLCTLFGLNSASVSWLYSCVV